MCISKGQTVSFIHPKYPTKLLHAFVVSNALLTPLGCVEAVLWRYPLYLGSESGPRQDRTVVVDSFDGVTEGHLLSVVSRVKQPTCVKTERKVHSYVKNVAYTSLYSNPNTGPRLRHSCSLLNEAL